jgi:hypothetical protein
MAVEVPTEISVKNFWQWQQKLNICHRSRQARWGVGANPIDNSLFRNTEEMGHVHSPTNMKEPYKMSSKI